VETRLVSVHRQRIIDQADRLFRSAGFRSISLDAIVEAAETTKTTFYKHFRSKDDLALTCLNNACRQWWSWIDLRMDEIAPECPRARIRTFFKLLGEYLEPDREGRFLAFAACVEYPEPHDPCHVAGRESLRAIEDRLHGWAVEAKAIDPPALAAQLAVIAKGAIICEIANRDGTAGPVAARLADELMNQSLGGPSEPASSEVSFKPACDRAGI
jgi:AcrR family transcriptional regulator